MNSSPDQGRDAADACLSGNLIAQREKRARRAGGVAEEQGARIDRDSVRRFVFSVSASADKSLEQVHERHAVMLRGQIVRMNEFIAEPGKLLGVE